MALRATAIQDSRTARLPHEVAAQHNNRPPTRVAPINIHPALGTDHLLQAHLQPGEPSALMFQEYLVR